LAIASSSFVFRPLTGASETIRGGGAADGSFAVTGLSVFAAPTPVVPVDTLVLAIVLGELDTAEEFETAVRLEFDAELTVVTEVFAELALLTGWVNGAAF